jgi:hypothetical protein
VRAPRTCGLEYREYLSEYREYREYLSEYREWSEYREYLKPERHVGRSRMAATWLQTVPRQHFNS